MSNGVVCRLPSLLAVSLGIALFAIPSGVAKDPTPADPQATYAKDIQPLLKRFCLDCHSLKIKKGELDLERFSSLAEARKDVRPWPMVVEMLENGEMPPKEKPQPTADERKRLIAWTRTFIDTEARARAGDPGKVVLRRLNNAEYNYTIRDLTGFDLQPAREFPADGASGEGFTNTGESLVMSPALLGKFLNSAKDIAAHAVLLPDGFRFSPAKTQRDWTNEVIAGLRKTYREYYSGPEDGRLELRPYLSATIVHRDELLAGKTTVEAIAAREKLNAKYLSILWATLTGKQPSIPLDPIRSRWRQAAPKDIEEVAAEIRHWQSMLWKFNKIGSYVSEVWQEPVNPPIAESITLKLKPTLIPGQNEVVFYLAARESAGGKPGNKVVWQRPRFEGAKQTPLLLRDVGPLVAPYEAAAREILADTVKYLNAAVESAAGSKSSIEETAAKRGLDAVVLRHWIEYVDIAPTAPAPAETAVPLQLLGKKLDQKPSIKGWSHDAPDSLPVLVSNSSDKTENIPGTIGPHQIAVHPTPTQFAGVLWKSPIDGTVRVEAKIAHVHPACGNGIAWWIEHRQGTKASKLEGGVIDLGKKGESAPRTLKLAKGDAILLAIGSREGNHVCDLTTVQLTISATGDTPRRWDLGADVADSVLEGNPHSDRFGNKDAWQFVRGNDPTLKHKMDLVTKRQVPQGSVLAQWRSAALDPKTRDNLASLAEKVQQLLMGTRPADEKHPNRVLYDSVASLDGPLFHGIDLAERAPKGSPKLDGVSNRFGLPLDRFSKSADEASITAPATSVTEVRLPAAIFKDREIVVEGKLDSTAANALVQFELSSTRPDPSKPAPAGSSWIASADLRAADPKQRQEGFDAFRRCFPVNLYFSLIVPLDEVVCLRMYFREDEHLCRLFLDDQQKKRLDRLWEELRFISQFPIAEHKYLPQFIGFVTQDQPKSLVVYFEGKREPFRKRAEEFESDLRAAQPKQLDALLEFAARAYRHALGEREKADIVEIYRTMRRKEVSHDEAFRMTLARLLISPHFIYRLEQPSPGKEAKPVNDWELATRLSYFLWSSTPDARLTKLAAEGRLHDPKLLADETRRMLKDDRVRALATEFGTQWIHVRAFDELNEKNEKLFPTFNAELRKAINEESVLFFQDLFQNDRPYQAIVDADYTYVNEPLAKHYGIPGVVGPQFRKIDGVKKFGRGGILGLASVQAKESGASRTSPVLRGNWVVETLLAEKIPRPPPNVPRLPEEEKGNDGLTMRQLVEKHTRVAECAVCHVRIDPYGFALEKYDPIGRYREKDLGGLPVDSRAKLRDGTEFEGIDGLRQYLLTRKREVFIKNFCKKLLGYSLGRAVTLSDQPLVEEMIAEMNKNDGRITAAVQTIVRSTQFRMIRGMDAAKEE
jgi:hypothetical protein